MKRHPTLDQQHIVFNWHMKKNHMYHIIWFFPMNALRETIPLLLDLRKWWFARRIIQLMSWYWPLGSWSVSNVSSMFIVIAVDWSYNFTLTVRSSRTLKGTQLNLYHFHYIDSCFQWIYFFLSLELLLRNLKE